MAEVFEIAGQIKLFKAGLMGTAVTVHSSYEGGYGPAVLQADESGRPVVVRLDDEEIETQLEFAGAYICGFIEAVGGDLQKTKIWLEPFNDVLGTVDNYPVEHL